jgi:hypothetical protein
MPVVPIILWTLVALAPLATIFAVWRIVTGPRLISKLMFRYLMKRRIAWVSLVAVMLCTAMVLIVISVMGGWLRMFRQTNHDLIGDLIVYRISLDGFEHYQDMLDEIRKIPEVKAATPTIRTFGLAEIGLAYTQNPIRTPVEVVGLDIKQIGQVNGFVKSLHLQKDVLLGKADELAGASAQTQREAATRSIPPNWRRKNRRRRIRIAPRPRVFPRGTSPSPISSIAPSFPNSRATPPNGAGSSSAAA